MHSCSSQPAAAAAAQLNDLLYTRKLTQVSNNHQNKAQFSTHSLYHCLMSPSCGPADSHPSPANRNWNARGSRKYQFCVQVYFWWPTSTPSSSMLLPLPREWDNKTNNFLLLIFICLGFGSGGKIESLFAMTVLRLVYFLLAGWWYCCAHDRYNWLNCESQAQSLERK